MLRQQVWANSLKSRTRRSRLPGSLKLLMWLFLIGLVGGIIYVRQPRTLVPSSRSPAQSIWSYLPIHNNAPTASPIPSVVPISFDLPVLMYHYIRISPDPETDRLGFNLSVTPENFRTQMEYLKKTGYTTVTPDEVYQALKTNAKLPSKSVLLTFDDGYADFYSTAYPVLKNLNLRATLFIVSGFVGNPDGRYVTWSQIKTMDQSGLITIGAHTVHHVNLTTSHTARDEVVISKQTIERQLGHAITVFAYPSGDYNDAVARLVETAGFNLAFTTQPGTTMIASQRFFLPRVRISGTLRELDFPGRLVPILSKRTTTVPSPALSK